jgi:hypothetical protein
MISTQRQGRKHTSPNPFFDFALAPEINRRCGLAAFGESAFVHPLWQFVLSF